MGNAFKKYRLLLPTSILLLLIVGVAGFIWVNRRYQPQPVHFDSLHEVRQLVERHDLHFHSGSRHHPHKYGWSLYVSDREVSATHLNNLTREKCGTTPPWKGIVWVVLDQPSLYRHSIRGEYRLWGNVVATGDPDLLDRLEELYRQSP